MRALILFSLLFATLLARTRYHLIEVEDKNEDKEVRRNDDEKENDHHVKGSNLEDIAHHRRKVLSSFLLIYITDHNTD